MRSLKILFVADANRHGGAVYWYNSWFKLQNGFIRAGHSALFFSERDVAREASFLPTKKLGIPAMQKKLIEMASHFQPDLIVFGHADLCTEETFTALRDKLAGVRMAQVNLDPTHRPKTMASFMDRAKWVDMSFITTGDSDALAPLAPRPNSICFMPNPVDAAIETARTFAKPATELAWDGLFLGTGIEKRGEQLEHMSTHLPDGFRFHYGGRSKGDKPLVSTDFMTTLASGAMCPNIPLDDTTPTPRLYSSDRIAQILGQGVLAFTHAPARLSELYEDGVIEWNSREELVDAMTRHWQDDAERRRRAEIGWRIAHERTSSERVASALVETVMDWPPSQDYGWPTAPLA